MPTFEAAAAGYLNLWNKCQILPASKAAADRVARGIIADKARYQAVEAKVGVPWFWIGCIHNREASRDFTAYLGNGEPLDRVTRLVPKGRGPFASWEAGAIDALRHEGLDAPREWSIARMLYEAEGYNGWGYGPHGENSPYVWAGTNLQQAGKFSSDGHYDPNLWDKQLGVAAMLLSLVALDPSIAARVKAPAALPPRPSAPVAKAAPSFWEALLSIFKRRG